MLTCECSFSSVFWDTTAPANGKGGMFYTQDDSSTVKEFVIDANSVTLQRQLEFKPLQKAIETYSEDRENKITSSVYELLVW